MLCVVFALLFQVSKWVSGCVVLEAVGVVHIIICKCVVQKGVAVFHVCSHLHSLTVPE